MRKILEAVTILKPNLLNTYVFEERQNLKLLREKNTKVILVANEYIQHLDMGVGRDLVASAASISQARDNNPALTYILGGRSLNTKNLEFIFVESDEQRDITLDLLAAMLQVIEKTGITMWNPYGNDPALKRVR